MELNLRDEKENERNKKEGLGLGLGEQEEYGMEWNLESFSEVEYINNLFPTEQSLVELDSSLLKWKERIRNTNELLRNSIYEQISSERDKGKQKILETTKSIQDLFVQISEMKRKAESSEKMVHEICRDIKNLDYAKKNVTTTITALKRMQMLITAIDQLKWTSSKHQYREAAVLLEAINELSSLFIPFKHISKLSLLFKQVSTISSTLLKQIHYDFESSESSNSTLMDACHVIDAMGKDSRREFINWLLDTLLKEYKSLFRQGDEISSISNIKRRFAWLKKRLMMFDERFRGIFPEEWAVQESFVEEFCILTRQNVSEGLERERDNLDSNVFVSAIKKTVSFENEMSERFGKMTIIQKAISASQDQQSFQVPRFQGMISCCYDVCMDILVASEDRKLAERLSQILHEETWSVDEEERTKILQSSKDLVYYFKTCVQFCSSLSKNQGLSGVSQSLAKYFSQYANALIEKLPSADAKLNESQEKMICLIINTSDYCSKTSISMGDSIRNTINSRFADKINFKEVHAKFEEIIANSAKSLSKGLENKLETALTQMTKMPWGSWESVGDQSDYVNQLSTYINQSIPIYRSWIVNPTHFNFFCDLFIMSFIPNMIGHVYKCRRLSEYAAQQLRVDFAVIRQILCEIPSMANRISSPGLASRRYAKNVNKEMDKVDNILKVVLSPIETVLETFKSLIPNGTDTEFQKILDLRGLSRAEQKLFLSTPSEKEEKPLVSIPFVTNASIPSIPSINPPTASNIKRLFTTAANRFNMPDVLKSKSSNSSGD
eukprot:TRINITY_DN4417_c0_g1_i1.p1 TRINITY_DN4417_c0_g1~~TRINITY_DN4417_c0_g1_i1.p1  ORF type:complete len:781 (+),score=218.28 TRINITY_DN4417_c0_g1_i1:86-2428(+)